MEFETFLAIEPLFSSGFLSEVEMAKPDKGPKPPKGGSKPKGGGGSSGGQESKKHISKTGK